MTNIEHCVSRLFDLTANIASKNLQYLVPCLLVLTVVGNCFAQTGGSSMNEPVFVPAPRELSRPLMRAREAISNKDWKEAIEYLGAVLDHPTSEDYLIRDDGSSGTATSLRNEAQRLLGLVPHQQREGYEIRFGIQARQQLEAAIEKADYSKIAEITRRYFHTPSGYLATMILGHHHLDEGRPVAAAACFQRVITDPIARKEHDPEAAILLSISWLLGNQHERAENVLQELKERQRGGAIVFNGKTVQLFDDKALALPWLVQLVGDSPLINRHLVDQWVMFRGDAQRNAQSGTGFPLPYPQWEVPTLNEPDQESLAQAALDEFLLSGRAIVPSLQPLAVNDTVIMRSATHLIGVNIRTGKRTWVFPPWDHKFFVADDELDDWQNQEQLKIDHITQRMWKDQVYGQASSDGKYVFVIDRPGFADPNSRRMIVGGAKVDNLFGSRTYNELKAAELERQGAFKWEVGGADGIDEPKLAGAFFLGAPLPLHGTLYGLCELKGEIRLVVLDAETGSLKWSQQIASVESTGTITQNMYRRLGGASPSYADGLLICPTSAGAVVAVDLSTQSLAWGFQYPIGEAKYGNRFRVSQLSQDRRAIDEKSIDATVTLSEGKVVLMPVECDRIFCLDLLTGKSSWTEQRSETQGIDRNDSMFVACVEGNSAILVGKSEVRSIGLNDGKEKWSTKTSQYGHPSGRGYVNRGHYIFPTTKSLLIKVRLSDGEVVDSARSTRVLGNLICYGNRVISHGVDYVASFAQDEPSIAAIENAEKSGDVDAEILKLKAQIAFQKDDLETATNAIEKAYQQNPSLGNQRFLMDVLLRLVESDFDKGIVFAKKYESILRKSHGFDYLAAKVDGLIRKKNTEAAFSALMELAVQEDLFGESNVHLKNRFRKSNDGTTSLRVDRWFRSRLQQLSESEGQSSLAEQVDKVIVEAISDQSSNRVYQLVKLFGSQNIKPEVRLELAEYLIEEQRFLDAEMLLCELFSHQDEIIRAASEGMYGELLANANRPLQALKQFNRLRNQFASVVCCRGKTGRELADQWLEEQKQSLELLHWNSGHMREIRGMSHDVESSSSSYPLVMNCMQSEFRGPEGISLSFDNQQYQAIVRDAEGQILGKFHMRPNSTQRRVYISSVVQGHYHLYGNLLVAQMGNDVIGIDMFRIKEGDGLLWHVNLEPKSNTSGQTNGIIISNLSISTSTNIWGETTRIVKTQDGHEVGNSTQISPNGICVVRGGQLLCVDPLTGEQLWRRSGIDSDSRMTSDEQTLAVIESDDFSTIHLYSLQDGRQLDSIHLRENQGKYWTHDGNGFLVSSGKSNSQEMRFIDAKSGGLVWERSYPRGTRASIIDNREIAVFQTDGTFEIVQLADGKIKLSADLEKQKDCRSVIAEKRRNNYVVLCCDTKTSSVRLADQKIQARAISYDDGLVDGLMYCINRETGDLVWDNPIRVEAFNFQRNQPNNVPVIVLARVVQATAMRVYRSQVIAIDERTGKLAIWESGIDNLYMRICQVVGDRKHQTATIDCGQGRTFTVKIGNDPPPPGPPVQLTEAFTLGPISALIQKDEDDLEKEKQRREELLEKLKKANQQKNQEQKDKNDDDK